MDDACHKATCAAPAAGSTLQGCATLKMRAMLVAGITACHVRFPAGTLVQIHSFSFIFHNNFLTIFFDSKLPQWGGGGNAQVSMLIQIHLINLFGTNPVDSKRADRESQSLSGLM